MENKNTKSKIISAVVMAVILIIVIIGSMRGESSNFYLLSTLVIVCGLIPFFIILENKKTQLYEIILIAVLSAIAVVSRLAFAWLPQVKPLLAIVIISGISLGAQSGFLVGAISMFISNFYFGQGIWTPWQMFTFGIIGFLAGIIFSNNKNRKQWAIIVYGSLATFLIAGIFLDIAMLFLWVPSPDLQALLTTVLGGIPFNIPQTISTAIFLLLLTKPMIKQIGRIKVKYGLLEI